MSGVALRDVAADDRGWVVTRLLEWWGTETLVSHDEAIDASAIPGVVAEVDGVVAGLATFVVRGDACELVTLNAVVAGGGVGSALLDAVAVRARAAGCGRLWLVTSNDNLAALRFYQRRGMRLVGVNVGAIDRARLIKPAIPEIGDDGIPLHDELVLELTL